MPKHHHQTREDQIKKRIQYDQQHRPYLRNETLKPVKGNETIASDEFPAYDIFQQKGRAALDKWMEGEKIVKNNEAAVPRFINEGNPNTQK